MAGLDWLEKMTQPMRDPKGAVQGVMDYPPVKQAMGMLIEDANTVAKYTNTPQLDGLPPMRGIGMGMKGLAGLLGAFGTTVYHGSPHKFKKFATSKIGTGEGAQAYGRGLYVADKDAVASEYMKSTWVKPSVSLSTGESFEYNSPAMIVLWGSEHGSTVGEAKKRLLRLESEFQDGRFARNYGVIKGLPDEAKISSGNLYKVDLPDEAIDKMLRWDQSLDMQPKSVRDAWLKMGESYQPREGEKTMGAVLQRLKQDGDPEITMREMGIPGIKYLDGESRAAGEGTYNYVVFDDDLLTIIKDKAEKK